MPLIENKKYRTALYLSISILISIFLFRILDLKIRHQLPYPAHIDEPHRLTKALKILQTGDFNPHYFNKPSFSIYLTSLGLACGYVKAASNEEVGKIQDIGSVSYPYYSHKHIVHSAKKLFLLFSVLSIFLAGMIAYKIFDNENLIFVPVLLIPFSTVFIEKSWQYINVNVMCAFFVGLSFTYIFWNLSKNGIVYKSIIPGVLCGLCLSSKFSLFPIYLPFLIVLFSYERKNIILYTSVLLVFSVLTLFLLNPYFLLDYPCFLNDTRRELHHYMFAGHIGFQGTPGLPQFVYYIKSIIHQYGWIPFFISLAGIFYMFKVNLKSAVIFLSFPMGLLIMMSACKVNFLRNLIPVYLLWTIFIASGVWFVYKVVYHLIQFHLRFLKKESVGKILSLSLVLIFLILGLPFDHIKENLTIRKDSRNEAVKFIKKNIPEGSAIIIPKDLMMDVRSIQQQYAIKIMDREKINVQFILENFIKPDHFLLIPSYGFDQRYPEKKKIADELNRQFDWITEKVKLIKQFGSVPIWVDYYQPVPWGDPEFCLAEAVQ